MEAASSALFLAELRDWVVCVQSSALFSPLPAPAPVTVAAQPPRFPVTYHDVKTKDQSLAPISHAF